MGMVGERKGRVSVKARHGKNEAQKMAAVQPGSTTARVGWQQQGRLDGRQGAILNNFIELKSHGTQLTHLKSTKH